MIRVVTVQALKDQPISGDVYVRSATALPSPAIPYVKSYEDELSDLSGDVIATIVEDLVAAGTARDITYVVPSLPGDATVAALPDDLIATVETAGHDRGTFGIGSCQVIDVLEVALAEKAEPFGRGLAPIDPTVPLVVTNWYGERVTDLASRRLHRVYGGRELPIPTPDFELLVEPIDHLEPVASIAELEQIVSRLRRPDGCPWDREQTRESLLPQFEEELAEFRDAIEAGDVNNQCEELGDLLFHVVAQCQVASEAGDFTLDDVLREVTGKLVRRHPHVFGDEVAESVDDVLKTWQQVKAQEKAVDSRGGMGTQGGSGL